MRSAEYLLVPLLALLQHTLANTGFVDPFALAQDPCSIIRNAEFVCIDCAQLARCEKVDGVWIKQDITTCETAKGMACDAETRSCKFLKECDAPLIMVAFECNNKGIYPDPVNCKYYHICNDNNEDTRLSCSNNYGYSISEKACVLPLNSKQCKEPQYTCSQLWDMDAWPDDKNMYYVCHSDVINGVTILYPRLYRCSNPNHIFDVVTRSCVPSTPSTPSTPSVVTCKNGQLIPDSSDPTCRAYYSCRNNLMIPYSCRTGYVFNEAKAACVYGSC